MSPTKTDEAKLLGEMKDFLIAIAFSLKEIKFLLMDIKQEAKKWSSDT